MPPAVGAEEAVERRARPRRPASGGAPAAASDELERRHAASLEPLRELRGEAVVERVGDDHDLGEDVVECLDVGRPVAGHPGDGLVLGELEVERQQVEDVLLGPVRVGAGEERRDLADVRGPARVVRRERVAVARLRGRDEVDRDQDVLLEQRRQRVARGLAVVRHDRRADVLLVLEQPARGRVGVGRARDRGDDVLAGPDDVVRPELAEREPDWLAESP